ncbi:hypothetical protein HYQ46_001015 [Verticillium longisporum]|nr:hypothetical protein HYQ46_001015 [Verticillium longisporum]
MLRDVNHGLCQRRLFKPSSLSARATATTPRPSAQHEQPRDAHEDDNGKHAKDDLPVGDRRIRRQRGGEPGNVALGEVPGGLGSSDGRQVAAGGVEGRVGRHGRQRDDHGGEEVEVLVGAKGRRLDEGRAQRDVGANGGEVGAAFFLLLLSSDCEVVARSFAEREEGIKERSKSRRVAGHSKVEGLKKSEGRMNEGQPGRQS